MEVLVRNAEGNVSQADREYAAKKLGRLDRYLHQAQKVEMVHKEDKLQHHVEITVFADGMTIRGEEHDESLRAAIDRVSDKLEVRLRKFKGRLVDRHRRKGNHIPSGFAEVAEDEVVDEHVHIVEHKHFLIKPMSIDEAALQMEMMSIPFYAFQSEKNNQLTIIYKRKDGKVGLMHPEMD